MRRSFVLDVLFVQEQHAGEGLRYVDRAVLADGFAAKKIRGVESQGMILMAENSEGELAFVSPDKAFEAGSTVR